MSSGNLPYLDYSSINPGGTAALPVDSANAPSSQLHMANSSMPESRVFPVKMLLLSTIVLIAIVLAHVFISDLEDATAIGLDVVSVASMGIIALLLLSWMGWFLLFSRWKWWQRIVGAGFTAALPICFFIVFRPVNGGDANVVRFEPIWTQRPVALTTEVQGDLPQVDLLTETPDDFPRFLGNNQNAVVTSGFRINPSSFSETKVLWKQPIGQGWSGFVARNGFAVTMEQRGESECVSCYDVQTGNLQWIYQHAARHRDATNLGRFGPRSTPTIHEGNVYAVGAVGNLVCLKGTDGSVVWQQDLNSILGLQLAEGNDLDGQRFQYEQDSTLAWGRAGSPLIVNQTVVVPGGGPKDGPKSTLLAFDLLTGELKWQGGDEMIAYGSPILATVAEQQQILLVAETKVMGFDPESGTVLWEQSRPGDSSGAANTSQVTVVSENQLLTSKGYPDGGGELLSFTMSDGTLKVNSVWTSSTVLKTKLTSPVIRDGFAYSFSNGFLECAKLSDGARVWKRRARAGHGQMLLIDNLLLVHAEDGVLYLVEATPEEYRELGSVNTIRGVCWNTLCLTGDRLLVRSELEAACLQLPAAAVPPML